jgi:hypothetical protein
VCGAPAAGVTGYAFFADGHSKVGVPFCKNHLDGFSEYASPVFENNYALALFQERHPGLYARRVKDKKILFLKTNESAP